MESLPKMCDYSEPMGVLPSGTDNFSVSCFPVNGSVFAPGQQIQIDLNNQGFLDPDSIIVRYKLTLTVPINATANSTYSVSGLPYLAPFIRCETLLNSAVAESVNNYNSLTTALANLQYSVSDKQGMGAGLGYISQTYAGGAGPNIGALGTDYSLTGENGDGLNIQVTTATTGACAISFYLSGPLPCLLSNAEKLIPLNGLNCRLQLTLDSVANICPSSATNVTGGGAGTAGQFSNFSISNFELVYNQISVSPQVERQMLAMPKIRIKTSSWATGIQNIPSATNGGISLIYNLRYASVKSMFTIFGSAGKTNKLFDSVDLTSANGSFQYIVNGLVYPQAQLSTLNNKGGVLMELRNAMRDIYTGNNSMSISNQEWNSLDGTATLANIPGKFYVGTALRKINQWGNETSPLFSGVSTQNSPITLTCQTSTVTTVAYSPILVLWYDGIIELDTVTKQVNYIY